jgi:hypothetical protein
MIKDMVVKILLASGKLEILKVHLDVSGRYQIIYPADFAKDRDVIEKSLPHKALNATTEISSSFLLFLPVRAVRGS